jgi:SAM-dependent methyltransferase
MSSTVQFDHHADTYDADLEQALSISGEGKDFFARGRVDWMIHRFRDLGFAPDSAIDYGCGIGDTSALLRDIFHLRSMLGLDVSARSLQLASRNHASSACRFLTFDRYTPDGNVDLVYCNGVFHHIPIEERASAVELIHRSLRPGGLFALWENNPWNPGTRYVMSQCVFDGDAVALTAPAAMRLVESQNFELLSKDFTFFFPKLLRFCRFLEPYLRGLPLGAQYLLLYRKI